MSTISPTVEHAGHGDHEHAAHGHHELGFVRKYIFSTDHKIIGVQFLMTTLLMLMVGGALATCMIACVAGICYTGRSMLGGGP